MEETIIGTEKKRTVKNLFYGHFIAPLEEPEEQQEVKPENEYICICDNNYTTIRKLNDINTPLCLLDGWTNTSFRFVVDEVEFFYFCFRNSSGGSPIRISMVKIVEGKFVEVDTDTFEKQNPTVFSKI